MEVLECENCRKRLENRFQLIAHQRRQCKSKICGNCNARFQKRRDLQRHEKNRKNISCTHCEHTFCSDEHFHQHLRTVKDSVDDSTIDLDAPINPESGYEQDEEYTALIKEKIGEIGDREKTTNHYKIVNRQIDSEFTYRDLETLFQDIYCKQENAFKTNLGFGFILFNTVENVYKYYYNSSNNMLFQHAITITDQRDLSNFLKKVSNLDLATNYYLKKPSSQWILAGLTNVEVFIFDMKDVPIGHPPSDLPEYIKKSKSILALTHDGHRQITDNKCFFRCLALHQGARIKGLERLTNRLMTRFENHTEKSFKNGVNISHIPAIEVFFHVSVNIYSLSEDGSADIIYLSRLPYETMHINLYRNHFSYINNFEAYAKRFQCQMCERVFDQTTHLKRHIETCCTEKEETYIGGKFRQNDTLFDRLEKEGIDVEERNRYYPFISVFDYEALQVPRDELIRGREIHFRHVPATFSICSNIPNHTDAIHCVSKGSPQELVDEMVKLQLEHQETASHLMRKKFSNEFSIMNEEMTKLEKKLEIQSDDDEYKLNEKHYKKLKSLLASLCKYCDQLIVIGFNSQKYDIPLIRRYLPSSLERLDSIPSNVIKKNTAYMAISTKRLKILDICNYLAAGTSLANFYKSYNVQTPKGFFPYQWFDSLDKLKSIYLPQHEDFYSILTNSNISVEDYKKCQDVWTEQGMKSFGDFVRYYNNHDVIGLVEAIEKMVIIENKNGLDVFKESVSLPGLTQNYLFKSLKNNDYFTGIGKEHSHIYKEIRERGIVGGPSIIFHRYHEAGETKIKGKETCKKVIGFDANSLYLSCMAQTMPTGYYSLREKKHDYKRQTRYSKQSIQWLEYLNQKNDLNIRHAENSLHGEMRIENYSIDGFDEVTNTIYEFYGCYHHGHDCSENFDPEKWSKTLQRENQLRSLGYQLQSITSCEWSKDPASQVWYRTNPDICTYRDILNEIMNDKIFGIVKYSAHVPEHLIDKFSEFPPIFKNSEITIADIGDHMQEFCRKTMRKTGVKRSLISSMWGEGIITLTPLFKKYVEMGLIITDIQFIMEYNPKKCFEWFQDEVVRDRRMADLDKDYKIRGETSKTKGNSAYGRTIMDKTKHTSIRFASEQNIGNHIRNPLFKCMEELNGDIYEVEKEKRKVVLDTPIQIGIAVYSYAKLNLLCFWEFINKFLVNDLYQLMECDTDSLYIAFARDTIDECVKPELKEQWQKEKWNFFSNSEDKTEIDFEGREIPFSQWDKRTPGKYKPEFEGLGMICLNSKVYHIWVCDKDGKETFKTSCKGGQKRRNTFLKENFLKTLDTHKPYYIENAGFIRDGLETKTYTQIKKGLGYFYAKRKVLSDGVSTTHLDI